MNEDTVDAETVDPETAVRVEGGWPPWVEAWVLPFVRDSGLWPVLFALLGHVLVLIAPLLLTLGRGNPAALLPLVGLAWGSVWLCRTERSAEGGFGAVTFVVGITWLASALVGYIAGATGVV